MNEFGCGQLRYEEQHENVTDRFSAEALAIQRRVRCRRPPPRSVAKHEKASHSVLADRLGSGNARNVIAERKLNTSSVGVPKWNRFQSITEPSGRRQDIPGPKSP